MDEGPKFGTSGLRGLASDLTDGLCAAYAQAFAEMVPGGADTVLIGCDLRESSPRIVRAVAAGVAKAERRPLFCGVLPTPALAYAAGASGAPAIMVTGSHIPADRNGLKFYRGAEEIEKSDEAPLQARVAEIGDPGPLPEPQIDRDETARHGFVERFVRFFGEGALEGARIGVWEHSSAARDILPRILKDLGAEVTGFDRRQSFVAVDTEAVGGDLRKRLAGWATEHGLDAVVSTDGDADRPLLTDEAGQVVPGDILGPVTARFLDATAIATPVSSNTMVEGMGFSEVRRTKIGSPYVIEAIQALQGSGARVAGYEPNGGFLLGFEAALGGRRMAPLLTRDFVLPILGTLLAAHEAGQSISAMVAHLPPRRTATDRLTGIPTERSRALVQDLLAGDTGVLPDGLGRMTGVDTTDGARMTFEGGEIVTIRPSGNAPELRAYVEAESSDRAAGLLAEVLARLEAQVR